MMEIPHIKAVRLSASAMDAALLEDEPLAVPERLHPVSQAFDFPDKPEYAPIRRALAAIDAAHDDGDLPSLPIELARDLDLADEGEYWSEGLQALKSESVRLKAQTDQVIAGEYGYWKWDDFEPVSQEIEKVFQKRGWL